MSMFHSASIKTLVSPLVLRMLVLLCVVCAADVAGVCGIEWKCCDKNCSEVKWQVTSTTTSSVWHWHHLSSMSCGCVLPNNSVEHHSSHINAHDWVFNKLPIVKSNQRLLISRKDERTTVMQVLTQ